MNTSQKISLVKDLAAAKLSFRRSGKKSGTLVIRLDRIGDFALFAPYVKSSFAEGEKTYLLVNELWAELCRKLFSECTVIPLSPGKFISDPVYRSQMLAQVRNLEVRRVIQARFYRELFVEELLALASAPEQTVRFQASPFHLQPGLLKFFSASKADEVPYIPGEHELERNARFAHRVNKNHHVENPWSLKPFSVPEEFSNKEYVCVFPGSGKGELCCWQWEKWGALLNALDAPLFLITGTPAEKKMIDRIAALLPPGKGMSVTDLTLEEFAGVVSNARCALGNDTGGIHLAAMSGVPSLAISGRGQPGWFLPYPAEKSLPPGVVPPQVVSDPCACENCFWRCSRLEDGRCACVAHITVDQVLEAVGKSKFSALR